MINRLSSLTICFLFILLYPLHAHIIHVPADSSTIQGGINGAVDGDTVLVADGTYTGDGNRDIDFGGRAIVVMSVNGSEVTIINCQGDILDPHRGFYFHSGEDSTSILQGFKIKNGYDLYGGGILCDSSSPMIIKCTFSANEARYHGGGMRIAKSHPTVTNCLFIGNSANGAGGGMYNDGSNTTVTNCTFIGNSADFAGGLENSLCDNPTVTNCILWNDSPDEISGSAPVVTYSDVEGGHAGVGNIDVDPRFVSFYGFDYFLRPQSPCVDKGDPAIEDFIYDWHPHWPDWYPNNSRSDMGAYGGPGNVGWLQYRNRIDQGFQLKEKYCAYPLTLDPDPHVIWANMEKRARNAVRKGE